MATHLGILAWRIPRTEEPGQLQSIGSHRVRTKGGFQLKIYIVHQVWGGSLYSNSQSQHVHKTHFWRNLNAINQHNPFALPTSPTPGSFQACPALCYTKYTFVREVQGCHLLRFRRKGKGCPFLWDSVVLSHNTSLAGQVHTLNLVISCAVYQLYYCTQQPWRSVKVSLS